MNESCVVAVFEDLEIAQRAVHTLHRGDFSTSQVSLVAKGVREQPEIVADLQLGDDSAPTRLLARAWEPSWVSWPVSP